VLLATVEFDSYGTATGEHFRRPKGARPKKTVITNNRDEGVAEAAHVEVWLELR